MSAILVRPLESIQDYRDCENIQRRIWGMHDATEIIPLHVLITAQKNGGLTAGAYDTSGNMIGMLFGFAGYTDQGKPKHCSHLMGVLHEVRRQNVGAAIKLFQRQYVLDQGLDLITWTFDPLEGVNASLNIGKLGTITHTYYHDLYGVMPDSLNGGLPTDRFEVEWWIKSPHVQKRLEGQPDHPNRQDLMAAGAEIVTPTRLEDGVLVLADTRLDLNVDTLLVEVPTEFQAIKTVSMEHAQTWRQQTGIIFDHYFARGYRVTNFLTDREDGLRRNFYVLMREIPDLAGY
jgi:predicted GNAT superfamily acetyltransferase